MADPRIKQLRIKTGIVKRMYKEKVSYEEEADQIQNKIKSMQENGEDVYYIKKQDQLLQETLTIIPDCQKRLNAAFEELKTLIETEVELEEDEVYKTAKDILEEAIPHISA